PIRSITTPWGYGSRLALRLAGTTEIVGLHGITRSASHRPVGQHARRHGDAELDLADRFDDVVAAELREAGIAPVVHVQAVGDDEIVDRDRLPLVPVAHDLEAREDSDMAQRGDAPEQPDHLAGAFGAFGDLRRILRIDQNDVGTGGL